VEYWVYAALKKLIPDYPSCEAYFFGERICVIHFSEGGIGYPKCVAYAFGIGSIWDYDRRRKEEK